MGNQDVDLPEPRPRAALSEAEYLDHRWKLWRALFIFAALYGALHKIAIPFVLAYTTVLVRDYTQVDFWAVPALLLAGFIVRVPRLGRWGSSLAGVLVAYAAWDARAIASGAHQGWLAWSHAISSLPQGLMAIVLLSLPARGRDLRLAWLGAIIALGLLVTGEWMRSAQSPVPLVPSISAAELPSLNPSACGAQAFQVAGSEVVAGGVLRLQKCGFMPFALRIKSDQKLRLNRDLATSMNLRIVFYDRAGQRHRQSNRILKESERDIELSELSFDSTEVAAVLFSDAQPTFGKVLILPEALASDTSLVFGVEPNRNLRLGKVKP